MNRRQAIGILGVVPLALTAPTALAVSGIEAAEAFMARVRNPQSAPFWASLDGEIRHKKDGGKFQAIPLRVRLLMDLDKLTAQIAFNGGERYRVEQPYGSPAMPGRVTSESPANEGETALADVGIQPADLSMGFLHWRFVKELDRETVKTRKCRVMDLQMPGGTEQARAWISEDILFPLVVEWRKAAGAEAYRRMEYKQSRKVKGVMLLVQVDIANDGWKSSVRFNKLEAGFVRPEKPAPKDLFLD